MRGQDNLAYPHPLEKPPPLKEEIFLRFLSLRISSPSLLEEEGKRRFSFERGEHSPRDPTPEEYLFRWSRDAIGIGTLCAPRRISLGIRARVIVAGFRWFFAPLTRFLRIFFYSRDAKDSRIYIYIYIYKGLVERKGEYKIGESFWY